MPELPEVETTLRGILPYLQNQKISQIIIRHSRLRWPIPKNLNADLRNQTVKSLKRRAKYLLMEFDKGTLILHLGMSGSLCIFKKTEPAKKHDHVDIEISNSIILRLTDPRRFGALLWTTDDPGKHFLLSHLGPEPLDSSFTAQYLLKRAQRRKIAIKLFIMDSKVVAGIGNIYATEALFHAGINPFTPANELSEKSLRRLVAEIKKVLRSAIKKGGTTLKDFSHSEGKPGYFAQKLKVYGRGNLPCMKCKTILKEKRLGQRNTTYCPRCQSHFDES